ncbi:MarC family protein [Shigella flexneri]
MGVVPLALPVDGGPGRLVLTIVWGTRYHSIVKLLFGFFVAIALFALCCWGIVPHGTVAGTGFTLDGINVITRIMGDC